MIRILGRGLPCWRLPAGYLIYIGRIPPDRGQHVTRSADYLGGRRFTPALKTVEERQMRNERFLSRLDRFMYLLLYYSPLLPRHPLVLPLGYFLTPQLLTIANTPL